MMSLATLTKPAMDMAEMGLGALALSRVSQAAPAGPSGPAPADGGWHRMPQQSLAWAVVLSTPKGRQAVGSPTFSVMGGRGRQILWQPFKIGAVWYATARVNPRDMKALYRYGMPQDANLPTPMALGAVPASAANSQTLEPRVHLDPHGVATIRSLLGIGTGDSLAVSNASLRRYAQLPVQPDPSNPLWKALSPGDLDLLQKQAGWSAAVAQARTLGESMFRFRGAWYMFAGPGYKVLMGGSGSHGTRALAGIDAGMGQVKPNFKPATAADIASSPPGAALASATAALTAYITANGVPDEHVVNSVVEAFQAAYNADPVSDVENDSLGNGKLNDDGEYGPNTQAAYGAILGTAAPAYNPTPVAPSATPTTPSTVVVTTGSSYTVPIVAGVLILAAGGIGYAAYHHKKHGGHKHAHA